MSLAVSRTSFVLRHNLTLLLGLVVVVFLGGWWLLWWPVWNGLTAIPAPAGLSDATARVKQDLADLVTIRREYEALSSRDLLRLNLTLPAGRDIPTIIAQFDGIAKTSNITIDGLEVVATGETNESRLVRNEAGEVLGVREEGGASAGAADIRELQVNITLGSANYQNLKQFITSAQQSMRLMNLTSLTFSSGSKVNYILGFRTTYLPF